LTGEGNGKLKMKNENCRFFRATEYSYNIGKQVAQRKTNLKVAGFNSQFAMPSGLSQQQPDS